MDLNFQLLGSFLPQFIAGGVASIIFYTSFRKYNPFPIASDGVPLEFYLLLEDDIKHTEVKEPDKEKMSAIDRLVMISLDQHVMERTDVGASSDMDPEVNSTPLQLPENRKDSILPDTQILLLSLDIWVLIALLLSPLNILQLMLPVFSRTLSYLLYGSLAALVAVSIITTVVSRVEIKKRILIPMLIISGGLAFAAFYAPSMKWVNRLNPVFHIVTIYSAVVMVCFAIYGITTMMKRKAAYSVSTYSSFASYGITSILLLVSLFTGPP